MTGCESNIEAISALVDGELQEKAELEAHMAECEECRALYGDFLAMSLAMRELEEPAPAELASGIGFKVAAMGSSIPGWKKFVGACAAVAACVVIALVFMKQGKFAGLGDNPSETAYYRYALDLSGASVYKEDLGIYSGSAADAANEDYASTEELPPQMSSAPAPSPGVNNSVAPTPMPSEESMGKYTLPEKNEAGITPAGGDGIVYGSYVAASDESKAFEMILSGDTGVAVEYFAQNSIPVEETGDYLEAEITVGQFIDAVREIPVVIVNEPENYSPETDAGTVIIELLR